MLSGPAIDRFIQAHRLPTAFSRVVDEHFRPLADWLLGQCAGRPPMLVGIGGAQGTGKSTLAAFLALALDDAGLRTTVLSIDDFYLTAAERLALAARIHPLLRTRGVPGTHDLDLLTRTLDELRALGSGESLRLPTFDKAQDDRADRGDWPVQTGAPDAIVLEGWCIGCQAQPAAALATPINELERDQDADGRWRHYVNEQLAGSYSTLFATLDPLIFLRAPNFDAVRRWRCEQEQKLAERVGPDARGILSENEIQHFVRFFERITRANEALLSATADAVLVLNDRHDCSRHYFNHGNAGP